MVRITVGGIPLEFGFSFFFLLSVIIFSGNGVFALSALLFSLLHEMAHGMTAIAFHYHPEKICVGVFGGVLHVKESCIAPSAQIWIHIAGPALNIVLAFLFYSFSLLYAHHGMMDVALANIVLGIFNLLPFYPLDGGKLVQLYLSFFLGFGRADRICRILSGLFVVFLFLLGIYLVQYNVANLLICALSINLAVVLKEDNRFVFYKLIHRLEQKDAGKERMLVCKTDTSVWKVLQTFRPLERRTMTVVNQNGNYKGQLNDEELLSGLYACGLHAQFHHVLDWKKSKKQKNGEKNVLD